MWGKNLIKILEISLENTFEKASKNENLTFKDFCN